MRSHTRQTREKRGSADYSARKAAGNFQPNDKAARGEGRLHDDTDYRSRLRSSELLDPVLYAASACSLTPSARATLSTVAKLDFLGRSRPDRDFLGSDRHLSQPVPYPSLAQYHPTLEQCRPRLQVPPRAMRPDTLPSLRVFADARRHRTVQWISSCALQGPWPYRYSSNSFANLLAFTMSFACEDLSPPINSNNNRVPRTV